VNEILLSGATIPGQATSEPFGGSMTLPTNGQAFCPARISAVSPCRPVFHLEASACHTINSGRSIRKAGHAN